MNKILAFDVSSNSCSVAIAHGQKILCLKEEHRPSMQAERLLELIESALSEAKLEYDDLDYVAVTNGPGSFTGIRIGLATAKGICLGIKAKEMAITNFEFSHFRAKEQIISYSKIVVLINAYRSQIYYQEFDQQGTASEPTLYDIEKIIEILKEAPEHTAVAGNGLAVIYPDVKNYGNLKMLPRFPRIKAVHLCRLADNLINEGKIRPISPLYIRPPDAKLPSRR